MKSLFLGVIAPCVIVAVHYGLMVLLLAGVGAADQPGEPVPAHSAMGVVAWLPEISLALGLVLAAAVGRLTATRFWALWGGVLAIAFLLGTIVVPIAAAADHRILSSIPS